MKTWDDIIRAAIGEPWNDSRDLTLSTGDPVLYQAVRLVERGDLTREQALIHAVLALSQIRQNQHKQIMDLINTRLPAPFVLNKGDR